MITKIRFHSWQKTYLLLALSSLTIVAGGLTGFTWQTPQSTKAADESVLGGPSLSATTVDHIFAQMGSPMTGTGTIVEQASRSTNIDDAFAMAVWWAETNDGMAGVGLGNRNPGSVRGTAGYPSGYDGYTIYPSYAAAITDWFRLIKNSYVIGRGTIGVYSISVPYVGTAGAGNWAYKVTSLMARYRYLAPPPPPAPAAATTTAQTLSPQPSTSHAHSQIHNRIRSYVPIGKETDWGRLLAEKRHQLWLAKMEEDTRAEKSVDVPLHHTLQPERRVERLAAPTSWQPAPMFAGGAALILIAILTTAGLAIGRRKLARKVIPPPEVATVSLHDANHNMVESRFSTTEELTRVPPTPILVSQRGVPLTPFMPNRAPGAAEQKTEGFISRIQREPKN